MSQTSQTTVFNDLLSSTINDHRPQIADNIFKKNAFWAKMQLNGRKETITGGAKIQRAVEYATNSTVQSFNGYDVVPIVPQEIMTDCFWSWKECAGNVVVSRRDQQINSGKNAIRSMIKSRIGNLERSFGQKLNEWVLAPTGASLTAGNGGKDLTPLTEIITLAASTVGEIDGTTSTWWDNQRQKSGSSNGTPWTYTQFKNELRSFIKTCSKHNDGKSDLILTSQAGFDKYEESMEGQIRYGSEEMRSLGFDTVSLAGSELAWDQIVPGTTANGAAYALSSSTPAEENFFFLNTDFLTLVVDSGSDMVTTPFVDHQAGGQFAQSMSMLFMGELTCTNRRTQGVLYGVDVSAITA
jgi:hypothetical protein